MQSKVTPTICPRLIKFGIFLNFRYACGIVQTIGSFGPSEMIVRKNFYDAIVTILDSIDVSNVKHEVSKSVTNHSVEVQKIGTVILAKYDFSFKGIVHEGCIWDSQEVFMKLEVKVWSFATLKQLKKEFVMLNHCV